MLLYQLLLVGAAAHLELRGDMIIVEDAPSAPATAPVKLKLLAKVGSSYPTMI